MQVQNNSVWMLVALHIVLYIKAANGIRISHNYIVWFCIVTEEKEYEDVCNVNGKPGDHQDHCIVEKFMIQVDNS